MKYDAKNADARGNQFNINLDQILVMHFGLSDNSWEDATYNLAKTKSEGAIYSSESEDSYCTFDLHPIKFLSKRLIYLVLMW